MLTSTGRRFLLPMCEYIRFIVTSHSSNSIPSILVLKDGQIVEQGSHKELLALDGIFASMWADQVSANEDPVTSSEDMKTEMAPYSVDFAESPLGASTASVHDIPGAPAAESSAHVLESPELAAGEEGPEVPPKEHSDSVPISFPVSDDKSEVAAPALTANDAPVAFPDSTSAPISFPSGDDTPSEPQSPKSLPQSPGVTFDTGANLPSRSGTPDPESEPKRKRISSQNFQRLARRISITTRRQGSVSSIIPGLKRESPRVSADESSGSVRGEGSVKDSPTPSVTGEGDKKSKKKDKKKRKSFIDT